MDLLAGESVGVAFVRVDDDGQIGQAGGAGGGGAYVRAGLFAGAGVTARTLRRGRGRW